MADEAPKAEPWAPPEGDQEFDFKDIESAPEWVNRAWVTGQGLALPAGDLYGEGPYHTKTARFGDKVLFIAATPSVPAHFEVIAKEPTGEAAQALPPQQTNAQLEDLIKTGWLAPDDLSEDAKAQVTARSPRLKRLIEDNKGVPEAVPVGDYVKTS
jgi:hypothetical protein